MISNFNEDIVEIINDAINSGINFDLLRLSGGSNRNKEKGLPLKLRKLIITSFIIKFWFKSGTGCYLINRLAAENINSQGLEFNTKYVGKLILELQTKVKSCL